MSVSVNCLLRPPKMLFAEVLSRSTSKFQDVTVLASFDYDMAFS